MKSSLNMWDWLRLPLAWIYALVMALRNQAYDRGWLNSESPALPVLSVGNLSAGGTGKTPITAYLVKNLLARKAEMGRTARLGIVSRGYGGSERGPARVPNTGDVAARFGDEPTWFAQNFPEVPVFVGADRLSVVRALAEECDVDGVIADDAFQHRRLKRVFDLVIVDASEPTWHYRSLPLGRLREGFASLGRASTVFITKTNLCDARQLKFVRDKIKLALPAEIPVIEWESRIHEFVPLDPAQVPINSMQLKDQPVLLVSAIGRPGAFRKLVEDETGARILDHLIYPDHHGFTAQDRATIEKRAGELQVAKILLTEKDAIKLRDWRPRTECLVSRLEMYPRAGDLKGFMQPLIGSFFKVFSFLVASLPRSWRLALGDAIGFLWFDVFRIRRDVAIANVGIAFPDLPLEERTQIARKSLHTMGRTIVEYSLFPFFNRKIAEEYFETEGWEKRRSRTQKKVTA